MPDPRYTLSQALKVSACFLCVVWLLVRYSVFKDQPGRPKHQTRPCPSRQTFNSTPTSPSLSTPKNPAATAAAPSGARFIPLPPNPCQWFISPKSHPPITFLQTRCQSL